MKNTNIIIGILTGLVVIFGAALLAGFFSRSNSAPASSPALNSDGSSTVLQVVAAENFWGSLVSQIGGTHVQVLSIVSDPNADPHEYESNASDARAVATANYIIENGAGYDSWMDKLVSAGGATGTMSGQGPRQASSSQIVFNVATFLGKKDGDNPHFWYSPAYVNEVVAQMEKDLIALDPKDAAYYQANYQTLQASLEGYQDRITSIKQEFGAPEVTGGTEVAATESIFVYLAQAAGLDLVSPPAFIEAVAEGNDPPAASVVQFEDQLKSGGARVLVYNEQTVTPLTESVKKLAVDEGIPLVSVTETIQPPGTSFQDWMNAQIIELQDALDAKTLGQ